MGSEEEKPELRESGRLLTMSLLRYGHRPSSHDPRPPHMLTMLLTFTKNDVCDPQTTLPVSHLQRDAICGHGGACMFFLLLWPGQPGEFL